MARYLGQRALHSSIALMGLIVAVFFLARLTGDPTNLYLPIDANLETRQEFAKLHGFDQPSHVQFIKFVKGIAEGDLGFSIRKQRPAFDIVLEAYPTTLKLAAVTMTLVITCAVTVGALAAYRPRGVFDRVASISSLSTASAPDFWVAITGILVFSVALRWLPTSGMGQWQSFIMPSIALAWFSLASLTRMTRSSMLDVFHAEYIRLARLKGLPEHVIVWKHAFRNAVLPIMTMFSLQLVFFVSGSVIVENIFAWPGIGQLSIQAIESRDYPLVQTIVFISSSGIVLLNLVVDILYGLIDPRIRR